MPVVLKKGKKRKKETTHFDQAVSLAFLFCSYCDLVNGQCCVPVVVVVIAVRSADFCSLTTKTVTLVPFLKIIFLSFLSCWFCQVEVCVCCVCVSTFQLTASAD